MQLRERTTTEEAYQAALEFLYQFVNYERKMTEVYAPEKMDPQRPARLLHVLGDPHGQFPSIHVAGTKGKGSVAAMCAACLRAAGLRVGLYTSPHLRDLRERIRVLSPDEARGDIGRGDFVSLVNELKSAVQQIPGLTWFELLTAVAFMYFAREQVDVAVVEVGLGGRLDATNVLTPLVSVITSLSLDHTGLLGNTLEAIATEKAGIIKNDVPVISASQAPQALGRLKSIARERKAPLALVGREWQYEGKTMETPDSVCAAQAVTVTGAPPGALVNAPETFPLALAGEHQQENAVVALATLEQIRSSFPSLTPAALREGLSTVRWPGRLQILHEQANTPAVLIDGAHNADSAQKLAAYLRNKCRFGRLWLILGVTADKNVPGILEPLLPLADGIFVTQANHPRATRAATLQEAAAVLGYAVQTRADIGDSVRAAWTAAGPSDLICVTGSLFVVGDLLNCWDNLKSSLLRG